MRRLSDIIVCSLEISAAISGADCYDTRHSNLDFVSHSCVSRRTRLSLSLGHTQDRSLVG